MKITIKWTNTEPDYDLEDLVRQKINELDKFNVHIIEANVEIDKTTKHHQTGRYFRVEANLRAKNGLLRAQTTANDFSLALHQVKDELQQQIKKYKGKQEAKQRRGGRLFKKLKNLSPFALRDDEFKKERERKEGN